MRAKRLARAVGFVALAVLVATCKSESPTGTIAAPSDLAADAVGTNTIRVSWRPAEGEEVAGYEVSRRTNFQGDFAVIASSVAPLPGERLMYFDTDVEPDTYYGYRVRAVSRLGALSRSTNIAGTKTAPVPGILIRTATSTTNSESADPDGYLALIRGPRDTISVSLAINGERLIQLSRGTYTVVLRGLAVNCATATAADTLKTVTVNDEGTATVAGLSFIVSCRDPSRASIVVVHSTSGDTIDADGLALTVSGVIKEAGTPQNERVYYQTRTLTGAGGSTRFDNLRLGDYEVAIDDIDPPCTFTGDRKKTLNAKALAVDTVRFALTCKKAPVPIDTVGRPFVLRQQWSSSTARPGDKVSLLTSLDLRAQPSQFAIAASADIAYDTTVVRFDSSRTTEAFGITAVGQATRGILSVAASALDADGLSGNIEIVRLWFTVVGTVGSSVRTQTTITEVTGRNFVLITDKARPEEGTLTVSTTAPNQPPTAVITAPTTGTVGTAITFSGASSSDPDGSIASYAWTFGDNGTGTGSSTTHTYTTAGTYTVRLTVTDNRNATGTTTTSITISPATASTGTISGTVTSPQLSALANVTVTVAQGGGSATTNASGAYTISNVPVGSRTVSVSGLPAACTAPSTQTVNVTAGGTATANFSVVCQGTTTTGTVTGTLTRASDNSPIANAQVLLLPSGASNPLSATTGADGTFTVANVPIGTGANAGKGDVSVAGLPVECSTPSSKSYTGLAAGGTLTVDFSVTCTPGGGSQTGTLSGTITKSTGGGAAGAQIVVTPQGASALPAVVAGANGSYTLSNVPVGSGTIAVSAAGCTSTTEPYSGVTAGGSVTVNVTLTCTAGPFTYPLTATWGPITNTGQTGRQVTMVLAIDMGAAPGRPDIAGNDADPLAALQLDLSYNGTALDYFSRSLLAPDEFDLVVVGEANQGQAMAVASIAVASTSGATKTGAFDMVRLTFNIAADFSGTITPTMSVIEATVTNSLIDVTSSVVVQPLPTLTIP